VLLFRGIKTARFKNKKRPYPLVIRPLPDKQNTSRTFIICSWSGK
jgi:hypothetical protein